MRRFTDLTGQRFGSLTVTAERGRISNGKAASVCICDCGNKALARPTDLKRGFITSCGCIKRKQARENSEKMVKHEATRNGSLLWPTYRTWIAMIHRCTNPGIDAYRNYGAKGVTVCERWRDFKNFVQDMGQRPSLLLSIDRIDPYGNYEPGNCRWATDEQQRNNKRRR